MSIEIVGWDYDTQELILGRDMHVNGYPQEIIRVAKEELPRLNEPLTWPGGEALNRAMFMPVDPLINQVRRAQNLEPYGGIVKVGDKWYDFIGKDGMGHNDGDWLDEGQHPRTERAHTRIDDTLCARVASPFWALAWVVTFGRFGRPMWRVA